MDSLRKMCAQRAARLSPDALEAGISRIAIDDFTMSAIEEFIKTDEDRELYLADRLDALDMRLEAIRNYYSPEFQVCHDLAEMLVIQGVAWKPRHQETVAAFQEEIWHRQRSLRGSSLISDIEYILGSSFEEDPFLGIKAECTFGSVTRFLEEHPEDMGMMGMCLEQKLEELEDRLGRRGWGHYWGDDH